MLDGLCLLKVLESWKQITEHTIVRFNYPMVLILMVIYIWSSMDLPNDLLYRLYAMITNGFTIEINVGNFICLVRCFCL